MTQEFKLPDSIPVPAQVAPEAAAEGAMDGAHWQSLETMFEAPDAAPLLTLIAYMVIGGVLAMYLRLLYRRSSKPLSSDSIAKVFPMLTLVTIAVIAVVKSSLALSLGLVGALSIVRFRAAIKDPEELVYLFLCIGVGLALGAQQLYLALALVAVASLFALFAKGPGGGNQGDAFVTIVGAAGQVASGGDDALAKVRSLWSSLSVHRMDVDGEEGQLRVQLHGISNQRGSGLVAELRGLLPDCQISYVNADAVA